MSDDKTNPIKIIEGAFPEVRDRAAQNSSKRELALALRSLRKKAGLTQTQLAKRIGWLQPQVSRIESPSGQLPETKTIVDYANGCNADTTMTFHFATTNGEAGGREIVFEAKLSTPKAEGDCVDAAC